MLPPPEIRDIAPCASFLSGPVPDQKGGDPECGQHLGKGVDGGERAGSEPIFVIDPCIGDAG
jgi:hypothetical protein